MYVCVELKLLLIPRPFNFFTSVVKINVLIAKNKMKIYERNGVF